MTRRFRRRVPPERDALLVGGVGVANTMVISVLERRSEIGLRRALGATHSQIRPQSSPSSCCCPPSAGPVERFGIAVTTVVPAWATIGGVLATLLIGLIAGLYPAVRAARLAPTEALTRP